VAEFRRVAFEDAVDFKEGPGIMAKDFRDEGVPLVRLKGLDRGSALLTGCNYLCPDMVERKWSHFRLELGDVLLSTSATLGRVAQVDATAVGAVPYTGIIRMRGRVGLDQGYLRYALQGPDFQDQVRAMGVGSVMNHFGPTHLRSMSLLVPPAEEQRRIAGLLGALDDKIDLNQRLRVTARQLGFALLRSRIGPDAVTRPLSAVVASIARGVSPKYDESGELVINQKCIRGGMVNTDLARRMEIRKVKPEKRAEPGDVLVNSTGMGTLGRTARWPGPPVNVDSHVTVVRPDPEVYPSNVLAYALMGSEVEIERLAVGSTGQTELNRDRLGALELRLPDPESALALDDDLGQIEALVHAMQSESTTLRDLQDTLLPKLLSGELRVRDAEDQVGAVA
jgi:type I restriction enzyme, S subunit